MKHEKQAVKFKGVISTEVLLQLILDLPKMSPCVTTFRNDNELQSRPL